MPSSCKSSSAAASDERAECRAACELERSRRAFVSLSRLRARDVLSKAISARIQKSCTVSTFLADANQA